MMNLTNHHPPLFAKLFRKTLVTGMGALQNRGELLLVELQEEKGRLINLLIYGLGALFLAMVTVLLLTGTIIFLFREEYRLYVAAGFVVLYLAGTVVALLSVKALLKRIPFSDTFAEFKKDRELLETFK
jgi:uncharacterized membrane protein YqjE